MENEDIIPYWDKINYDKIEEFLEKYATAEKRVKKTKQEKKSYQEFGQGPGPNYFAKFKVKKANSKNLNEILEGSRQIALIHFHR